MTATATGTLAPLLERFFTQRLITQRQVSPHTVSAYRDTFRLLLGFARQRLKKSPAHVALDDIDAPLIAAFLDEASPLAKTDPVLLVKTDPPEGSGLGRCCSRLRGGWGRRPQRCAPPRGRRW